MTQVRGDKGMRKQILVIEDERDIAELIRLHLDDLGFFHNDHR